MTQSVEISSTGGKYIVLWAQGARIASVEHTPENLARLQKDFCLSPIQEDAGGTEHYDVLGTWRKS